MQLLELSYTKLTQVAPDLAKHIVSFRDLTEELSVDEGIELGAFIIEVNTSRYFIPVMSKAGSVYPLDSIFSVDLDMFLPLTKDIIVKIITSSAVEFGKTVKPADTVNITKNPSVYQFVTPPRTGKVSYASTKLPEVLAQMPGQYKQAMLSHMTANVDFSRKLASVFDISDIISALKHVPEEHKHEIEIPAVQVVTGGDGLSHESIQSILNEGYAIIGAPKTIRFVNVVTESDYRNPGYTTLGAIEEGKACKIVLQSGEELAAVKLPGAMGALAVTGEVYKECGNPIVVKIVEQTEDAHSLDKLLSMLSVKDPSETGGRLLAMYGNTPVALGTTYFHSTSPSGKVQFSSCDKHRVHKQFTSIPSFAQSPIVEGTNVVVGPVKFYHVIEPKHGNYVETNLTNALLAAKIRENELLPVCKDVAYDCGEFYVNGKSAGDISTFVRQFAVEEEVAPEKIKDIVKQAKKCKHVKVFMSKKAEEAMEPSYGQPARPQPKITGDAKEFSAKTYESALKAENQEVAENVIISELLQDPNMYDTIGSYLPEIASTVDRIGRILFLSRLNSSNLAETIGYNNSTEMLNSLRNVYRLLGDNYVKLERLVNNVTADA